MNRIDKEYQSPTHTGITGEVVIDIRFKNSLQVHLEPSGKLHADWDNVVWDAVMAVGAMLRDMTNELPGPRPSGTVLAAPYLVTTNATAELGVDLVSAQALTKNPDAIQRIWIACEWCCQQVASHGIAENTNFEYSASLDEEERRVVQKHVDLFRLAWGGKIIPRAFSVRMGEASVVFSGRFGPKLVKPTLPTNTERFVGSLIGAELKDQQRLECNVLLTAENRKQKMNVLTSDICSRDLKMYLFESTLHELSVQISASAAGKNIWNLLSISPPLQQNDFELTDV